MERTMSSAQSVGGSCGLSEMDLTQTGSDFGRTYPSIKDYYNANSTEPEEKKPIQLQPGLSNYSGLVMGDDRITINESIMSAQMRITVEDKLCIPSPSKAKSLNLRRKEYKDAHERVGDIEINRLERLMKDKLVQRPAKKASMFQVQKAFKFFDRDQCNRIHIEGFTRALEFLGFQFSELQNMALFARYDTEQSGEIDYGVFIANAMFDTGAFSNSPQKGQDGADSHSSASSTSANVDDFDATQLGMLQESEIRRIFLKVDKHQRGSIDSKDDLELLILALGVTPSAQELSDYYLDLSSGGTSPISFEAFYSWWCDHVSKSLRLSRK